MEVPQGANYSLGRDSGFLKAALELHALATS